MGWGQCQYELRQLYLPGSAERGSGFKRQTFFKFDLGGCTGEVNAAKLWVYGSMDQPGDVTALR